MPEPVTRYYNYVQRLTCKACGKIFAEDTKVLVGQRPPAARDYWCDNSTCQKAKDATPDARNERLYTMLRDLPTLLRMLKKGKLAGQLDDLFIAVHEGHPLVQHFPKEMVDAAKALPKARKAFLAIQARRANPPAVEEETPDTPPEVMSRGERPAARV